MDREEIIAKIMERKQFSELLKEDVVRAFEKFDKVDYSDEEKIKLTRNVLRKSFSGFGGAKISKKRDIDFQDLLKKHLSTRERYEFYEEVYERILKKLGEKISVVDLGCGINGLSFDFFKKVGKEVDYSGIEAMGQFANLTNFYFEKEKIKGKVFHESLFNLEKVKEIIQRTEKPRIVFLFKVVDALEKFERNYTKKLLEEIVPLSNRIVISFPTESWMRRKKFFVQRKWLTDFIRERWQFIDDFNLGGERYLVFNS